MQASNANTYGAYMEAASKHYTVEAVGLQGASAIILCRNLQEVYTIVDEWLGQQTLGQAGQKITIEELPYAASS